jgi:predicted dehydrogenase
MHSKDTEANVVYSAVPNSLRPPLRLAVIGCAMGRTRYHAALQATSFQITGLADVDERYARVWARELGSKTPAYPDIPSLLERTATFDALLVASPLAERAAHIQAALQTGKPVLAECPFAVTLSEVDTLRHLVHNAGLLLLPALPRRFDAYFLAAAQQLQQGAIGDVQQTRCGWSFPLENVDETEDVVTGGWNALVQTLGCQTADVCRWWQGDGATVSGDVDLQELRGGRNHAGRRMAERALANLIVTHSQGQSTHHLARTRAIQPDERYLFSGTAGNMELIVSAGAAAASTTAPQLRLQAPGQKWQTVRVEAGSASVGKTPLSPASLRILNLLRHFADCVQADGTPRVTADDAYNALEIVQAAYVSTQERVKISLPLRHAPNIAQMLLPSPNSLPALPPSPERK